MENQKNWRYRNTLVEWVPPPFHSYSFLFNSAVHIPFFPSPFHSYSILLSLLLLSHHFDSCHLHSIPAVNISFLPPLIYSIPAVHILSFQSVPFLSPLSCPSPLPFFNYTCCLHSILAHIQFYPWHSYSNPAHFHIPITGSCCCYLNSLTPSFCRSTSTHWPYYSLQTKWLKSECLLIS